jgi:hypothetical protein
MRLDGGKRQLTTIVHERRVALVGRCPIRTAELINLLQD